MINLHPSGNRNQPSRILKASNLGHINRYSYVIFKKNYENTLAHFECEDSLIQYETHYVIMKPADQNRGATT